MRRLLLLPFALLATTAARAECEGTSTPEITQCAWDEYEAADKQLNAVWKQVMATFTPAPDYMPAEAAKDWRDSLLAAQRAWVTFKEKDCNGAVAYEWYGGTGANAAVAACMTGHTLARIEDLTGRYLDR